MFDIKLKDTSTHLHYTDVQVEADRLGLMMAQIIYDNTNENEPVNITEKVTQTLIDIEDGNISSCLGGVPEGFIIKHPNFDTSEGIIYKRKKCVTNAFKEYQSKKKVKRRTEDNDKDNLIDIGTRYATSARFAKAIQHLREEDKLDNNKKKNIRVIKQELDDDLIDEMKDTMIQEIWEYFREDIEKAHEGGDKCFGNIYIDSVQGMTEDEIARIKQMLWIEYNEHVIIGSKKGFVEWYLN